MGQKSSAGISSAEALGATLRGDSANDREFAVDATLPGDTPSAGKLASSATLTADISKVVTGPYERVVIGPVDVESVDGDEPWTPEALPVVLPDKRYALAGELARGGLGRILKAYDKRLARQVAIKELLHTSTESVKRFLREAKITAGLEHPSIVPVHDVGRWPDGVPFYSMKLVHGRSLEECIAATTNFSERVALVPNLVAVAEAIAYAHNQGVIHRDLKPRNILVGSFGETLVIDWGLAKAFDDDPSEGGLEAGPFRATDAGLTAVGAIMGTPSFMAPEQARGQSVDARADVYALGSILYYMLTGTTPYGVANGKKVLQRLLADSAPPVIEREPNIPPDLRAIVDKAMQRHADNRYPSAREFAADLKRFHTGQLVGARTYSAVDLARRWLYRHRALVGLSAAAAVMLIVAGVLSFHRIAQERDVARQKTIEVEQQRRRAVAAQDEALERGNRLVLQQAQSQLAEDPTAAIAWLKQYPEDGEDWNSLVEIAEKANNAGYARAVWTSPQPLTSADISPDGRRVATVSRQVGVRVYDLDTGATTSVPELDTRGMAVYHVIGDQLAIAGSDRSVYLWNGKNEPARVLASFDSDLAGMLVAEDRRRLLVATDAGELRLFDLSSGENKQLAGHKGRLYSADFSPDGTALLTGGEDGQLRLWNLASGQARVLHRDDAITWVSWAPDGAAAFIGLRSGLIEHRDLDGALLARFEGHRGPILAGAVSPDGTHFATGSTDKTARVWSVKDQSEQVVNFEGPVRSVEYSPDGKLLALSGIDRTVRLVRSTGSVKELRGHDGPVWRTTFAPDGSQLVTVSEDRTLRVWPVTRDRGETVGQHAGTVTAFARSADGWAVATGSEDGSIAVYDIRGGKWQSPGTTRAARVIGLSFLDSDSRVAALHAGGEVLVWTKQGGSWQSESLGRRPGAVLLASSAGSDELALVTREGDVHWWDARRGLRKIASRGVEAVTASGSPDGEFVAVAFDDATVSLYDAEGREVRRLEGHGLRVRSIAFAPDGSAIATGSYDGTIRVWRDGETQAVLQGHLGPVLNVSFADADRKVTSAGVDGIVRIWDANTGKLLDQAPVGGAITTVDLSPDGTSVAAAGYQGEMRLFDLARRRPFILSGPSDGVTLSVAFAPGGRTLLAANSRGSLRRWELDENGDVAAGPPAQRDEIRQWLRAVTTAEIDSAEAPFPRSPTP